MSGEPDVTVVTAVYNTMPYLVDCLESLAAQTIGPDRYEVIAVDDGSTDGGPAVLDRYAESRPDVFTLLRQPNSGGPAAPSNRALEHARGRYVFFIGSDDRLGPESLERMVDRADEWGSDVLLCKMVGVGGRKAPPVFERTEPEAAFPTPEAAWALSNTKLFRRDLVEKLKLRFPEDMAVCSDVPFTLRALAAARRISILVDYDHYFAVRRERDANLIYSTAPLGWVGAAERIAEVVDEQYGPGPGRDELLYRLFSREIAKALQPEFLGLEGAERARSWEAVAAFADARLTEPLRLRLPTEKRVRLSLAQHRDTALLEAALAERSPRFLVDDGRLFVRYPGFRDEAHGLPDEWFEAATERVTVRFSRGVGPVRLSWTGERRSRSLECRFRLPLEGVRPEAVGVGAVRLADCERPRPRTAHPAADAPGPELAASVECRPAGRETDVVARMPAHDLAADGPGRWSLRGYVALGDFVYDLPLDTVDIDPRTGRALARLVSIFRK